MGQPRRRVGGQRRARGLPRVAVVGARGQWSIVRTRGGPPLVAGSGFVRRHSVLAGRGRSCPLRAPRGSAVGAGQRSALARDVGSGALALRRRPRPPGRSGGGRHGYRIRRRAWPGPHRRIGGTAAGVGGPHAPMARAHHANAHHAVARALARRRLSSASVCPSTRIRVVRSCLESLNSSSWRPRGRASRRGARSGIGIGRFPRAGEHARTLRKPLDALEAPPRRRVALVLALECARLFEGCGSWSVSSDSFVFP